MTRPAQIVADRLKQALEADPRSINEIVRRARKPPRVATNIRGLLSGDRLPSLDTIWEAAETLDLDPLWLLGSDLHQGPKARPRLVVRAKADRLSPRVWSQVEQMRADGSSWAAISQSLLDWHRLIVPPNTLRRAYLRQQSKKGVASSDCTR